MKVHLIYKGKRIKNRGREGGIRRWKERKREGQSRRQGNQHIQYAKSDAPHQCDRYSLYIYNLHLHNDGGPRGREGEGKFQPYLHIDMIYTALYGLI